MKISIEACRVNAKMTRREFAEAFHVDIGTIYSWESGHEKPSLLQLNMISELSGIPIENISVGEIVPII